MPGGTITYENRNLFGNAASLAASVNTKNFLQPADDLSFRVQYSQVLQGYCGAGGREGGWCGSCVPPLACTTLASPGALTLACHTVTLPASPLLLPLLQPYLYGLDDPKRTRLTATLFNGRKVCGVFTPGPSGEEVPAVWVDRMGAKVGITEQYSRASKGTLSLVAQQITTLDETGVACTRGMRTTPFGQYVADGPPTCLSGERAPDFDGQMCASRLPSPACSPALLLCLCLRAPDPPHTRMHTLIPPVFPATHHPPPRHADNGTDRIVSAQGSLTRDTTYFANGAQLGARDIFTVS